MTATSCDDTLAELSRLGSPTTKRTYQRHGGGDDVLGVSFADISKIAGRIKRNHALAQALCQELWQTGQPEARIIAMLIADPAAVTPDQAERWVREVRWHLIAGYLAALVGRSSCADAKMRLWMADPAELVRETGYSMLSHRLKEDADAVSDSDATKILATIERELHGSPNRARAAMNMALIAIGIYKPALRPAAIAAAGRIGKVHVDHGDTACKTPDAIPYIEKAAARPAKKGKAKPAAKPKTQRAQ